jgi:hypothetical protein
VDLQDELSEGQGASGLDFQIGIEGQIMIVSHVSRSDGF